MLLSGGSGQVEARVASNHPKALPVPKPHGGAMKCHIEISSAIFDRCTILEILPAVQVGNTVGSALCNGRGMEEGSMLSHKRPVIVMPPGLFICLRVSGNPSPSRVSPSSFIFSYTELTVLWGL